MDKTLFMAIVRDSAIETTVSNLLMAGLLLPGEEAMFMGRLTRMNDLELTEQLRASRLLLDHYLENHWSKN